MLAIVVIGVVVLFMSFSFFDFSHHIFLLIEATTLRNHPDENTMHSSDKSADIVISRLKHDFAIISEWF